MSAKLKAVHRFAYPGNLHTTFHCYREKIDTGMISVVVTRLDDAESLVRAAVRGMLPVYRKQDLSKGDVMEQMARAALVGAGVLPRQRRKRT